MIKYGTPSEFQKKNRILVSTLAAYGNREVPLGFEWLKKSCDKFGIELTIFGWGTQFTNMYDSKLSYLGNCIWNVRNDYDYVINIDSADTLFLRSIESLPFKEMTFMAERNCFPLEQLRDKFIDNGSSYKFLNAGGFTGTMKNVIKTFCYMAFNRAMLSEPEYTTDGFANTFTDDQACWSVEYLKHYVNIDKKCEMFQTLWGVDKIPSNNNPDFRISDFGFKNYEHCTYPMILHGNGSANYDEIYKAIIKP